VSLRDGHTFLDAVVKGESSNDGGGMTGRDETDRKTPSYLEAWREEGIKKTSPKEEGF